MLEYKAETLAGHGAAPAADRRPVAVDLRHDWPQALRDTGFDTTRPTAWLAEGLLPFLPAAAQEAMFTSIDMLSGSGSRVAVEIFGVDEEKRKEAEEKWAQLRAKREARGEDTSFNPFDLWFDDEGRPDCGDWFAAHGWTTRVGECSRRGAAVGPTAAIGRKAICEQLRDGIQALTKRSISRSGGIFLTALLTGWLGSRLSPMSARAKCAAGDLWEGRTAMTTESVAPKTQESANGAAENAAKSAAPQSTDIAATVARLRQTFASGRTRSIEWRKQQLLAAGRR